ncbi:MAG: TonB-dependent receptor [Flavobacteriales bacterium]
MKQIVTLLLTLFTGLVVLAQQKVSGVIQDAQTGETLIGANVVYGTNQGVVTDFDGRFEFTVKDGDYKLEISYVGYISQTKKIRVTGKPVTLKINLKQDVLDEVTLVADIAQERLTPVAFTSISPKKITEELGGRDLPLVLNQTPGVYATQSGGGDGDARINIRGFKQENMAVMIDGIPVNDMENGAVYWSNWFGLDAITSRMQVQRGLSASKLSIPSVGGTINILTTTVDSKEEFKVKQNINQFGKSTTALSYNSGLSDKGWSYSGVFTYKKGDNYVDNSEVEGFFAYGKITKKLKKHIISLSSFVAPQEHDQRSYKQRIATYSSEFAQDQGIDISKYNDVQYFNLNMGRNYNRNWGYVERTRYNSNVERETLSEKRNFYMKPQVNLNHTYIHNERLKFNTALYLSIGRGGGTGINSSVGAKHYTDEGLLNWQHFYDLNAKGVFNKDGDFQKSTTFLEANRNDHNWYGLLSKVDYDLDDSWNLSGGIDLRSYEGRHYKEVYDLLGGDYYIDPTQNNKKLRVGDKFEFDNSVFVKWAGVFGQAEYSSGNLSSFLNLSLSHISFKKEDYFLNYQESGTKSKFGGTIKTGANYNLDENSNVFFNVGYLNKARPSKYMFNGFTTQFRNDTDNEVVYSSELGYHYGSGKFSVNANAYYTVWDGKPVNNQRLDDGEFYVFPGIDARHMGIEVDGVYKLTKKFEVQGTVSLGDWIWTSENVTVDYFDQNAQTTTPTDLKFSVNDIHVGDSPQNQVGISLNYKPVKGGYIRLKYGYFAKYYSDFSPQPVFDDGETRYQAVEPWKIPNYSTVDLFLGYSFNIKKTRLSWNFSMYNIFDTFYISDAQNNAGFLLDTSANNDAESASVFFGAGRNFSTSIKLTF